MTDAELDLAYRSRGSLPPAERAAVERAHAEMVARYNSEWGTPDNVAANLDAAASPVMPDPVVGAPVRKPVTPKPSGPPPTKWQELMEDPRNFSVEEADSIAAESDHGIQGILEGAPNRYERFGREMNELDARLGWERGHPAKEAPYPDLVPGANASPPAAPPKPAGLPVEMINGKPYVNIDGAIYPADSPMVDDPGEYTPTDYGYGTMLVDGIQVPIATPADGLLGQPAQYRLGDVEAERRKMADHSRRAASRRHSIEENRKYGSPYLPSSSWSEEQARARVERKQGEVRRSNMGYAHRQRIRSLADALNVSEDVAAAAYENAMNGIESPTQTDRPSIGGMPDVAGAPARGVGYAPGQLLDSQNLLTPAGVGYVMQRARRDILADAANNGAVDVRQAQKKYSREAVIRRAQAQQNPLEYLGRDDINDWQRMAMAERFLRQPQAMTPLGVEAVGAANAMRNFNFETMAGMSPMRERMAAAQLQANEAALPEPVRVALSIQRGEPMGTGGSASFVGARYKYWMLDPGYSSADAREAGFRRDMEGVGYKPEQIDAFLDGRRPRAAEAAPAPARTGIPPAAEMLTPSGR